MPLPRQGRENLSNTVKSWGRGPNRSMLPLRGKQEERPWQIFGFYSEREELPVSEKKRKERQKKKKKKDGCFETKAGAVIHFMESLPGSGFNSSRVKKVFFFPLKTKGGARVKELSLK